jgi:Immunity protein 26
MAKRQRVTEGAIIEINIENQYYVYAQILGKAGYVFFDYKSTNKLEKLSILENAGTLFIVAVYDDVITQGTWLKVGKLLIREDLKIQPMQFIQDALNPTKFRLYNPNTGEMIPATKDECKGLEVAAVYEAEHIELRISDYYAGRVNLDRQKDLDVFN